jgi:ferredoxin--NADP+ reductase
VNAGVSVAVTLPTARIVRRRDCTEDLFLLWLEPSVDFRFTPGQYITIGAAGIERAYSIVSAPHERYIELFIELVHSEDGGRLTPVLRTCREGDELTMRPKPRGRFIRRDDVTNSVMVSTVTGIAPYVSMIRHFLYERERRADAVDRPRFFVMQGASHRDEFVYDAELQDLSARHPDVIQYVGSVSRPFAGRNAGWSGPTGRINLLIEEYLDRWRLPKDDTLVYLCGHPGMIDDAIARLKPKGWVLVTERFWRGRASTPLSPGT